VGEDLLCCGKGGTILYTVGSSFRRYLPEQEKNFLKVMSNHSQRRGDGRITVVA
jgi:hypothetical protein